MPLRQREANDAELPAKAANLTQRLVCLGCSLVCDDIFISTDPVNLGSATNLCPKGIDWLADSCRSGKDAPDADADSWRESSQRVATSLLAARRPLVLISPSISNGSARIAVEIADKVRGAIDIAGSRSRRGYFNTLQTESVSACTLGEAKARADLIIAWQCDPVVTHPRLFERHILEPEGQFVFGGRLGRRLIVVNSNDTAADAIADEKIPLSAGSDYECLTFLLASLAGKPVPYVADTKLQQNLLALVQRVRQCNYGVLLYDGNLGRAAKGDLSIAALLRFVSRANEETCFVSLGLTDAVNRSGVEDVLTWETGYPFAVDFSLGYPRHDPITFAGENIIQRGGVDLVLLIGEMSSEINQLLGSSPAIPFVQIGAAQFSEAKRTVNIPARPFGYEREVVHRLDGVPIAVPKSFGSDHSITIEEALRFIATKITESQSQDCEVQTSPQ